MTTTIPAFKTVQVGDGKKKPTIERLENVFMMYVKLQKPQNKYQSTDTEYCLNAVLNEDLADEFAEKFPKASVKKIKTSDFEGKYKFSPPFPEDRNQFVIKMGVRAQFKDRETGEMVDLPYHFDTRPKVYELVDGTAVDITLDKQVGNGSVGHIQYAVTSNSFGTFCYPRALLITDLVEYQSKTGGSDNPFSDMGLQTVNATPTPVVEEKKEEPKAAPVTPTKIDSPFDDEEDFTDLPF